MANKTDHLDRIISLCEALEKRGLQPVLVGGIALIILGSQRVTKDFDFLVSRRDLATDDLVKILYKHRFELVTKFNKVGEVQRTVDNPNVAATKLKSNLPDSIFFFDWGTRLKIDLLLDFPLPAKDVVQRATKVKIKSHTLRVASMEDLLRMKEIAFAERRSAADAQDLEFLNRMLKT